MFIRFKRVRLAEKWTLTPRYSIHVVLVESFRTKGKPRQRVLKYLGCIRENQMKNPLIRKDFLKFVETRIDELDFRPEVRARLKVELIRKTIQHGRPF